MLRPGWLRGEQRLEHRFEQVLATRRLEQADHGVGAVVEGRVAHHDAHLVGVLAADVGEHRVEGAARLAGGIKELDDRDRCVLGTEHRGVGADQGAAGRRGGDDGGRGAPL